MAERIEQQEFKSCLKKNKIVKFAAAKKLVVRELKATEDDWKVALESLNNGYEKWAKVQVPYA